MIEELFFIGVQTWNSIFFWGSWIFIIMQLTFSDEQVASFLEEMGALSKGTWPY